MKRMMTLLLATVMLIGTPVNSYAANAASTEDEPSAEAEVMPITFSIDDTHRYEAMERSYQDGYLPTVQNGTAVIILPIKAEGEVAGNTVTVTPELGSTEGSPFIFRNYQKTVLESQQTPADGGEAQNIYYIRMDLQLAEGRMNGVYPVSLTITARDSNGLASSQLFTMYVTITDGKSLVEEVDAEPVTQAAEKPESQPILLVSSYSVNPGTVQAGEEFEIHAFIQNTNTKQSVQNMTITAEASSDSLVLLEDSNIIYWNKVGKGSTKELVLRYRAEEAAEEGNYHIMLSMAYDNEDAVTLSSSGDLLVSLVQPMRVQGEIPIIASSVNAGDTISLNFQAVNLGRGKAYNVRFKLDAPGLIPAGSAFIGNLEGGTAGAAEIKVFIGTKNMNRDLAEGEALYGESSGKMTLIYEDESGNEYTEEFHFSTFLNELVVETAESTASDTEESSGQWWISIAAGAVLLAGLSAFLIWKKRSVHEED